MGGGEERRSKWKDAKIAKWSETRARGKSQADYVCIRYFGDDEKYFIPRGDDFIRRGN